MLRFLCVVFWHCVKSNVFSNPKVTSLPQVAPDIALLEYTTSAETEASNSGGNATTASNAGNFTQEDSQAYLLLLLHLLLRNRRVVE